MAAASERSVTCIVRLIDSGTSCRQSRREAAIVWSTIGVHDVDEERIVMTIMVPLLFLQHLVGNPIWMYYSYVRLCGRHEHQTLNTGTMKLCRQYHCNEIVGHNIGHGWSLPSYDQVYFGHSLARLGHRL